MYYDLPPSAPAEIALESVSVIPEQASKQLKTTSLDISAVPVQPSANHAIRFAERPSPVSEALHSKALQTSKPTLPEVPTQVFFSSGPTATDTVTSIAGLTQPRQTTPSRRGELASTAPIAPTPSMSSSNPVYPPARGAASATASSSADLTSVSLDRQIEVTESAQATPQLTDDSDRSDALRIGPRFGVGYTTSGGSYSALGQLQAFVPIWQTVGDELGFLEGRLALGDDSDFGGSLLLGYRNYNEQENRIRGGYIGFDARDTGESTFYQLGAGYERLGEDWDFRVNGYFPLGDRTQVTSDISRDTGLQVSTGFTGNQFVLNSQREQQRLLQTEVALGGFDAEAGYRLTEWDGGDLTAAGGLYMHASPETPTYLGWQLRLAANITPNFSTGLAVRDDGLFGTRLVLSVGASFPGNRPSGPINNSETVQARLGESIVRLPEIAVTVDEESDITVEETSEPLMNPEEEQPYRFQHVVLGATGGDGTFENPFGTVQEALRATVSDGNDVVYVDGEADIAIPALTIPERVQVLSQGPVQTLAGLPFASFETGTVRLPFSPSLNYGEGILVELPFSGDGNFPRIEDGVTLSDRTVLAGFRIDGASGDAIVGDSIRDVELRNNTITNAGGRGIAFNNVGGSAVLFDTVIRDAAGQGIFVENTTSASSLDISIFGYELENNAVGMEFSTLAAGGIANSPSQVVAIAPSNDVLNTSEGTSGGAAPSNSIINSSNEGLLVRSQGTGLATVANQEVSFDQGTITGSGGDGIRITADSGAGSQELSVTNSVIISNNGAGIEVRNGLNNPTTTAYAQEIFVRASEIAGNTASGVDIGLNSAGAQEITIDSNEILNNGGDGIRSVAGITGLQEFPILETGGAGISGNTIAGNAEQAIDIEVNDSATIAVLNVRDNDLQTNGGDADVDVRATATSTRACVVITGNTAPSGIELGAFSTSPTTPLFLVQDLNTLSFQNNGALVRLINDRTNATDPAAFTNETDACIP